MRAQHKVKWTVGLALALAAGLGWAVTVGSAPRDLATAVEQARRSARVLSKVYTVDGVYPSMTGPWETQQVRLDEGLDDDELVWITGYRAVMVGADGETRMPQDFMCHSNLDLDVAAHARVMGPSAGFGPRLFTLSQGQLEARFPPGFGIPVRASEPLSLTTQVLNLNVGEEELRREELQVRHRVSIEYVAERDVAGRGVDGRMVPLMPTAAYGLALLEGDSGHFGVAEPDEAMHGPGCLVEASASDHSYDDGHGRSFSGHWRVPPGRQVNRTLVTRLMAVPYDTTIHYIAVHLHPFAESLELRDLTEDRTLFHSRARNFSDRIGLAHVEHFASEEGLPVHPDHEYELVSVYDNTSGQMQDSMAVMYIYLRDLEMERRLAQN